MDLPISCSQIGNFFLGNVVSGRSPTVETFQFNGGSVLTAFIYLVLLAVAAGAAIWFLRKNKLGAVKGGGRLAILETKALGGRQFLVVGKYSGKTFLLGVCPGRIDYLCLLEEEAASLEAPFGDVLQNEEEKAKP